MNEYIVGTGPPTLTIVMHRENIWPIDVDNWPEEKDDWIRTLEDPRSRTAAAYEGRELVMFLRPPISIAVEAWNSRGLFRRWFVQRDDENDIRAVAEEISYAETPEQRNRLDLPLTDLVAQIRTAAVARTTRITASSSGSDSRSATRSESSGTSSTVTTAIGTVRPVGGLGDEEPVPLLVTDANYLRNFCVEVGAVYDGDDATTVLPPPAPEPPGVPTNVVLSTTSGKVLITWDEAESGGTSEEYRLWFLSDLADGSLRSFYNVSSWQGERSFEITYMVAYFGAEFTVQVRAGNYVGYSAWTEKRTFTAPGSSGSDSDDSG